MRRQVNNSGEGDGWMNTYADTITLLLTFFILLYSMSTIDAEKWQQLVTAFNKDGEEIVEQEMPVIVPSETDTPTDDFDNLYLKLRQYVDDNDLSGSIEINKGEDYTFIAFKNNIFFDGDRSYLREDGKEILNYLCDGIDEVSDIIWEMRVLGHTSQARVDRLNNQEIDRRLSTERANTVLLYIQQRSKIEPSKLVSVGYGQYRPLNDNSTEALRIANRRVEILISKESSDSDKLLNEIYDSIRDN